MLVEINIKKLLCVVVGDVTHNFFSFDVVLVILKEVLVLLLSPQLGQFV